MRSWSPPIGKPRRLWFGTVILAVVLVIGVFGIFFLSARTAAAAPATLKFAAQVEPEVVMPPSTLDRLSWGAVIAGSVIAIIIQLALNLLGIAVGMMSINPRYGEDSASPEEIATGTAVWVGGSTLIALFVGGWLAARFAGIPDTVDGMLHGLMVWGVVMLVSLFLITTAIGRLMSGITSFISQGLHLAGQVTQNVAQGVSTVAQSAAHTVQQTAERTAANVSNTVENAVDSNPEVSAALNRQNLTFQDIMNEARTMLRQAGIAPERVESTAQSAVQDVQTAARQVAQNPAQAGDIIATTLDRVFQRGQNVVQDADRDAVVRLMMERGNMTEQQARETLRRWEGSFDQARQEVERTRQQAEQRVGQLQRDVQQRVEQVRDDAERTVREAAQTTTHAISRMAAAVFAAIVIGAIAAGVGGLIGAPENVPAAEVTSQNDTGVGF